MTQARLALVDARRYDSALYAHHDFPRTDTGASNAETHRLGPITELESVSINTTACALGGWAGYEVMGAYAVIARHAVKNAESD